MPQTGNPGSTERHGRHETLGHRLKAAFLAGVLVLLPSSITAWLFYQIFNGMDDLVRDLVYDLLINLGFPGPTIRPILPGFGVVAAFLFVLAVGAFVRTYFGARLKAFWESLLLKLPMIREVFSSIRHVAEILLSGNRQAFRKVVLVQFPRPGIWSLAFLTAEAPAEVDGRLSGSFSTVFIPTTPNPTSGWMAFVPTSEMIVLDMTPEEGLKMVLSGGLIRPGVPVAGEVPAGGSSPAG